MANTLEQQIKSLDLKQNAIKILINSAYGAFGNRYFYFHNNDIAQSITLQGQDLIKFSIRAVNHYFQQKWHLDTELHEKLGITGYKVNQIEKEAAIYTDTDSVYLCFDYAVRSVEGLKMNDREALEFCLAINRHRLKGYFEQAFEKYAAHFNTDNRQNFELENLSRSGIWLAKKKYILKVSYKDNKHERLLDKESLIIKGLEAIQASYPIWARNHLQTLYSYLLDIGYDLDLEQDLIPRLMELRDECGALKVDEIAFNFSVRVYEDYLKSLMPLVLKTGMPIYGRAAAYHNHLVKKTNSQKYALIRSGSKIKFYYAAKNEHEFDIFAYAPGSYPEEFAVPLDREQQFFRLIVEPINKLLVAMGYPELTPSLTRKVEVIKSRSRKKEFTDEETFPLYAVNSESLEYFEIPESCQAYIGNPDLMVPPEIFTTYVSSISKYGLNTVIVPNHELHKYRERVAKKKGIEIEVPKAEKPEKPKRTRKIKEADEA
jgi:DNA polymerase family B